ncbi:hypothetical protein, partial [Serratia sp. 506_PEND]
MPNQMCLFSLFNGASYGRKTTGEIGTIVDAGRCRQVSPDGKGIENEKGAEAPFSYLPNRGDSTGQYLERETRLELAT